ncbi:Mechanosensitive ion channel [Lotmaria passim]
MKRFFNSFYSRTGIIKDAGQRSVASRVSALALEGVIVFTALGTLGVDTSPLIAAAGVTGATIGFACKDFGANFVASIALSGQQALRTGNKVSIGVGPTTVTGTIVDWDTRYLYLRNDEQAVVCVPNNVILNSVVTWKDVKPNTKITGSSESVLKDNKEWKAAASGADSQNK